MTSNNGSGGSSGGLLVEISNFFSACFMLAAVIMAALAISIFALEVILPSEVREQVRTGAPPPVAVWTSLIVFQLTAGAMIVSVVALTAPGTVRFTFALDRPQASFANLVALFAIVIGVQILFAALGYTFFPADAEQDLGLFRDQIKDTHMLLPFAALIIGAPLTEELLFRGYLMNRLSQTRLGFGGAAIVSTTGWTILHVGYSTIGIIEVFVAGLLFSWVLWKTASLWVPILFHAAYNGIVFIYLITTHPSAI